MNEHHKNEFCDAVPIKINRVFDSCCDKDCIKDIQVCLECGPLPCEITVVKSKCVKVTDTCMTVEALPFNKGFFSVSLTYTFEIELYAFVNPCDCPQIIKGTAHATKNCILYGCEANTKTFFSNGTSIGETDECCETINLPTVAVQIAQPLALETKICKVCATNPADKSCCYINNVVMTLGLFSVIELMRPATILVPTFEYKIPHKSCECETEDPCEVFEKICFPVKTFSPECNVPEEKRCNCNNCNPCNNDC
jgi:hypothetical protein